MGVGFGLILSIGPSEDGGTDLFACDGAGRLRESQYFVQQRNPLDTDLLVDSFETGDISKWNRTQHWETSTLLGYVFDEHGNLLKEQRNSVDFRTHATNSATNRLTSGTYDAAGNLTFFDNVTTTFDALNRVVKRQASGGTPLYFLYTADDERTVTYDPNGESVWLRFTLRDFDGKLIRKVNETSSFTLVADEDVIFRGDQPLGRETFDVSPTSFHLSLDHLGSVRTTTNGAGAIVAKKKYYPFGEEATPFFEQAAIALKYTGHERDAYDPAATGDDRDYMHARFASPITGRFLSVDPVGGRPRRPQSWNSYAYTMGNPVRYIDVDGRVVVEPTDKRLIAALAAVRATPSGERAYQALVVAPGSYSLVRSDRVFTPIEERRLKAGMRLEKQPTGGGFTASYKGGWQSGGVIAIDFRTVDRSAEAPYNTDLRDPAITSHEMGHAVHYETLADRSVWPRLDYETVKEPQADALRDAVLQETECNKNPKKCATSNGTKNSGAGSKECPSGPPCE